MYLEFFGLNAEPFGLSPNLRFLYPSRAHEETMAHLAYGLERGEEIILITGMIGIGKTLAIQSLTDRVANSFRCVVVNTTTVTFRELLKLVMSDLRCSCDPRSDTADLISALKTFIAAPEHQNRRLLLVIDEAQNLQSDVLEGLRLLLNVVPGSTRNPVIVLAGQPGLEETIGRPELRQLRQRIRVHYRMEPLTREETDAFIRHRLQCCGLTQPLFSADAVEMVHHHSGGVPRLVNHLADKALLSAFVEGKKKITKAQVDISDLPPSDFPTNAVRSPVEPAVVPHAGVVRSADLAGPAPAGSRGGSRGLLVAVAAVIVIAVAGYFFWPGLRAMKARTQRPDVATGAAQRDRLVAPVTLTTGDTAAPSDPRQSDEVSELMPSMLDNAPARESSVVEGRKTGADEEPEKLAVDAWATTSAISASEPPLESQSPSPVKPLDMMLDVQEYGVHVASFRTMDKAANLISEMAGHGYTAVQRSNLVNGVQWRRVVVGPIRGNAQAESLAASMRAAGLITYAQILLW